VAVYFKNNLISLKMKKILAILVITIFMALGLFLIILAIIDVYSKFGLIGIPCFIIISIVLVSLAAGITCLIIWAEKQLKK
jgi:hypothetical protein